MHRSSTTFAKIVAAPVLSAILCLGAVMAPAGLAQAAGASYTIVNNTGSNIWFKGYLLEDPAAGSVGSGWLAPRSYTIKTKNEFQLNAEFVIVDEKRAMVMMQQTNGCRRFSAPRISATAHRAAPIGRTRRPRHSPSSAIRIALCRNPFQRSQQRSQAPFTTALNDKRRTSPGGKIEVAVNRYAQPVDFCRS